MFQRNGQKSVLRLILVYFLAFLLWLTTGMRLVRAGTPLAGTSLPDMVEKVAPGVVNISSTRFIKSFVMRGIPEFFGMLGIPEEMTQKQSSLGTGFLIDDKGYILTNHHVIEKAAEIFVTLLDKRRLPAKIVGRDKVMDLALIQIKGAPGNLKPNTLGNSDAVRIGETVFAIGNPFGLQHTVTAGIISAKNRTIGIGPLDDYLQTDASINFGNSGGPLFNMKGDVIGINTAINAQGQGLGFAIPIQEAKEHLNELKNFGYIVRSWLGVMGETITPAHQEHYQLPVDHGLMISRLAKEGPAAQNGLDVGDILTEVNGQKITEKADVQRIVSKLKPGSKIKLKYNRRGRTIQKDFSLSAAPDITDYPDGVI